MILQSSSYAIRALAALAQAPGQSLSVRELAERAAVPTPFLGKIMCVLARRKLVSNQRGKRGGSMLAKPASTITLYDVCAALEDPTILSLCLLGGAPCSDDRACPAHSFWRAHQAELIRFLKQMTVQDVADYEARQASNLVHLRTTQLAGDHRRAGALTIVCGRSGSGKTSYCRATIERATRAGHDVAGILGLSDPPDGERMHIIAHDLRTGVGRPLADVEPAIGATSLRSGRWWFNAETIAWANQVLHNACPCDLLVVDEIGPLELRDEEGLCEGLRALDRREYGEAIVTTRPSLLRSLCERWPWASVLMLDQTGGGMGDASAGD